MIKFALQAGRARRGALPAFLRARNYQQERKNFKQARKNYLRARENYHIG